jgi:sugar O-acyltransferase (sialic acid O-acetyltransferase NeuD family)
MNLVIIGAGGLAREIYDLALVCCAHLPDFTIKGFLSIEQTNIEELGYPKIISNSTDYVIEKGDVFFCAIGGVLRRKKVVEKILNKGGKFINLIHPSAIISPSVQLGAGIAIKSYCVISSDVTIGDFTFLQSSVIMGHDVKIGKFCQVNSFSFFAGYAEIGDCVTVNAGAKLIQNVKVEEEAVVGIGSVVLTKVKKGTTVFGSPAKRLTL